MRTKRLVLLVGLLLSCQAWGATIVILPGGASSGVDWNNPANISILNSAVCGNTYIVGGNAVEYDFTALSITISTACASNNQAFIYKAVQGGLGAPEGIAGWNNATMGIPRATFRQTQDADPNTTYLPFFTLSGTYITLDGVTPALTPCGELPAVCLSSYGFHLISNNKITQGAMIMATGSNVTVRHTEDDGVSVAGLIHQTLSCSRTSNVVTMKVSGSPRLKNGASHIDMVRQSPTTFNTPISGNGITITSATADGSGNTDLVYPQTGANEVCAVPADAFMVNNIAPWGGIRVGGGSSVGVVATDNYIHDLPAIFGATTGCTGCTMDRNFGARNFSSETQHANFVNGIPYTDTTINRNIAMDQVGTSIAVPVGTSNAAWTNIDFDSNLVMCSAAGAANGNIDSGTVPWAFPKCGVSTILSDDNGQHTITGMHIWNNTFVRMQPCKFAFACAGLGTHCLTPTTGVEIKNNVMWCSSPFDSRGLAGMANNSSQISVEDYNSVWAFKFSLNSAPSAHDHFVTIANDAALPSIFTSILDASMNFSLASSQPDPTCTAGTNCLDVRTATASPGDIDLNQVTYTSSRGAYQFVAAASSYPVVIAGSGGANGKICTDGTTCTDGILNAVSTAGVISGTSTHTFTAGSTATLTATATTGQFVTFSGGGCTTSPCTITVNSPLTITATFQNSVSCSLTFASNSVNAPSLASATTTMSGLSGPNSFWFIFGPDPDNLPVYNCSYPFSNCNANGQTGNIIPVGSGKYTGGACSNGVCCVGSTAALNVNTGAGSAAH